MLFDSSQGIVEGDINAAEVARRSACSTLIVLSKWDESTVTIEDVRPELQRRLRQRPPFITTSAHTGRGISRLLERVAELYDKHTGRIPTGELNRFLGELREARQMPSKGRRSLNLLYGAQVTTRPAAVPLHRQRPGPRHARLRLLGREPVARALRARGRARRNRLPEAARLSVKRVIVVGGGAWGSAFAKLLAERGHAVTLAVRDAGRAYPYGLQAAPIEQAPFADADLIVLAVTSRSFREVAAEPARLGAPPQPREGARPGDRRAPVDARRRTARSPCSRGRTWPTRSRRACRGPP